MEGLTSPFYFNCTIQELKHRKTKDADASLWDFNCTIQELKPSDASPSVACNVFQLHHTGIKTLEGSIDIGTPKPHFNCTIQELKLERSIDAVHDSRLFQLHHTGIKTARPYRGGRCRGRFQLHHTGIKTTLDYYDDTADVGFQLHHTGIKTLDVTAEKLGYYQISIAPYRN